MAGKNASAFRELAAFNVKLKSMPKMLRNTSAEMLREAEALVDEGFEQRVDPAGKRWKRRKRSYPWPILNKTLKLRKGWKGGSNQHYFGFSTRVPWARFHQRGTRHLPVRAQVPSDKLSAKWQKRLAQAYGRSAARHFSRR